MAVIINIRPSKNIPARQQKAWDEFLDMLMERAEAMLESGKSEGEKSYAEGKANTSRN